VDVRDWPKLATELTEWIEKHSDHDLLYFKAKQA
jgi:hypothetical protein